MNYKIEHKPKYLLLNALESLIFGSILNIIIAFIIIYNTPIIMLKFCIGWLFGLVNVLIVFQSYYLIRKGKFNYIIEIKDDILQISKISNNEKTLIISLSHTEISKIVIRNGDVIYYQYGGAKYIEISFYKNMGIRKKVFGLRTNSTIDFKKFFLFSDFLEKYSDLYKIQFIKKNIT